MTLRIALRSFARFLAAPAVEYDIWRERIRFRRQLTALLRDTPYLLDDVGFDREAAEVEAGLAFFEPVRFTRERLLSPDARLPALTERRDGNCLTRAV